MASEVPVPPPPPPLPYPPNLGDRFHIRYQPRASVSVDDDTIRTVPIVDERRINSLKASRTPDLDAYLRKLGHPGRFQVLTYVLLTLGYCMVATNNLASVFYSLDPPEYICANEEFSSGTTVTDYTPVTSTVSEGNRGVTQVSRITRPGTPPANVQRYQDLQDLTMFPSWTLQCFLVKNVTLGTRTYLKEVHCNDWRFPAQDGYYQKHVSTVTEFQLLCDKAWMVNLATTIYFIGVMLGALIFGYLADRFGRRVILLVSSAGTVVLGIATAFAPNYIAFVVFRFTLGIFVQGVQGFYVLIIEWFPSESRAFLGTLTETFWSTAVMLLALYGYLLPNWSHLTAAIAATGLILTFAYFFTVEESLRWLLLSNKTQEAASVSARVLKFNRISKDLPWDMEHELLLVGTYLQQQHKKVHYSFLDCFRTKKLIKTTFCLSYIWFSIAVGYYGLSFSIPELFGNTALNLFIGGALEMIPNLTCAYVVPRWGRKRPTIISLTVGGLICLMSCLLRTSDQATQISKTCLVLAGRMAVAGAFCSIIVWTSELYPTVIRANGMGVTMMGLRIGGIVAPQIALLAKYSFKELPVVVLGILVLLGAIVSLPLPETINQHLPDTLQDAEKIYSEKIYTVQHSSPTGTDTRSRDVELPRIDQPVAEAPSAPVPARRTKFDEDLPRSVL